VFGLTAWLLAIPVAEVVLRAARGWDRSWLNVIQPDERLGWRLRPGWSGRDAWTPYPFRISAAGIRDDRPTAGRAPGERRLLVLGDSVVFGYGVRTADTFPARLEDHLREAGGAWRVLNGGVVGYDVLRAADWLDDYGWPLEPDGLVVELCRFGVNRPAGAAADADAGLGEYSLAAFRFQRAARSLRLGLGWESRPPATTAGTLPPADERAAAAAYRRIAEQARARGVPAALVMFPYRSAPPDDPACRRAASWASELGWRVIDLAPAFAGNPAGMYLPDDPVHPNAAGHDRAAAATAPALGTGFLPGT
jgi:lysophospholipase L1-like esterase